MTPNPKYYHTMNTVTVIVGEYKKKYTDEEFDAIDFDDIPDDVIDTGIPYNGRVWE